MSARSRSRAQRPDGPLDFERRRKVPSNEVVSHAPWDDNIPIPKLTFRHAGCVVAFMAVLCFVNSYSAEFVFDDSEAIIGNDDLQPETPISDLFVHDFWGKRLASNTSHKSYRPLTVLTFRMNYYLAEGLHPTGFHLCNIILHAVVCVLFLKTFSVIFGHCTEDHTDNFPAPKASLLAAVLFAVHPVHTESVAGVVGRADLMCAICFLLSFLLFVKSCKIGAEFEDGYPTFWLLLSMFFCAISVLFKENGITVLGVCSAFDIIAHNQIDILYVTGLREFVCKTNQTRNKTKVFRPPPSNQCRRSLIWRHFIMFVSGMLLLTVRWRIMGSSPPTFQQVDNPHSFVNGILLRALNYNYLYAINAFILMFPIWLCFDWSMGCIPVIETYSDPRIVVAVLFWVVLGCLLSYSLRSKPSPEQRMLIVSLAMLIIPFLPASNLLFRVGFVVAERILYLPSAGFIMIVVIGISKCCSKMIRGEFLRYVVVLLVVVLTARSVQRSSEWQNELRLFESGLKVCPLNAKVHYNIGKLHGDGRDWELGMKYYRAAIELYPEYDQAMNNLGNLLKEQSELVEAEYWLEKAVATRGDFAAAWMNLAIVQSSLKKNTAAEGSYRKALQHRKKYPDCYYNLGNLYLDLERHAEALSAWRNATLQKPKHVSAWCNIIILLDNLGRTADIEVVAKEGLYHNPEEASIHYNVANALGKASKYEESEKHFLQAIQLDPTKANYFSNLGVLYHRWNKLSQAEKAYQSVLQLDPHHKFTLDNLKMLYKKMGKDTE